MSFSASQMLVFYFRELERRGIPYVILHSYENLPDGVESDVDYAVPVAELPRLDRVLADVADANGWALVQILRHGLTAYYAVLVSREDPRQNLRLDACSHYARACRLLVPEEVLLKDRRRHGEFWIPAPAAEFIYVLTKLFDAKMKSPAEYIPGLRALWLEDKAGARKNFEMAFGETGRTLEEWFAAPVGDWNALRSIMLERNKYGLVRNIRELGRVISRTLHPTGLQVAVLGSDGSGKSTVLIRLQKILEPCFRREFIFHFRPKVFEPKGELVIPNPHGHPPRGSVASVAKLLYYFADHWAGWLLNLPAKARSTLIFYDRNFEDILIDPERYRLARAGWLVHFLNALLPRPDLTIVLVATPEVIHQRKMELPLDELRRQQTALRDLAGRRSHVLVSADESPEEVALAACRHVVENLAIRMKRNLHP